MWSFESLSCCIAAADALRETQNKRRREKGPLGAEQSPERKSSGKGRRELRPRQFHRPRRPWSDQCQPTDRWRGSRRRCALMMTGIDLWLNIFLAVFKERNRNWTVFYGVFPMYSRMCCCVEWDLLSSSSSSSSLLVCLLLWQSVHASDSTVICIKSSQCLFLLRSWLCTFCKSWLLFALAVASSSVLWNPLYASFSLLCICLGSIRRIVKLSQLSVGLESNIFEQ